jgi:YD repeat-containing protein
MKMMLTAIVLALSVTAASAQQTRFYAPDGKSLGTATPYGNGSVRYYDSRGNSLGTSTTTGSGTTFYDARGNVTGRTSGPAPRR